MIFQFVSNLEDNNKFLEIVINKMNIEQQIDNAYSVDRGWKNIKQDISVCNMIAK